MCDFVSEGVGEERPIDFDHDVGNVSFVPPVNHRQLPRVNFISFAQSILQLHFFEDIRCPKR